MTILSEDSTMVLLSLAADMAVITENPDGFAGHSEKEREVLVGLLSPFDGTFDLSSTISIPRSHLPKGFSFNVAPRQSLRTFICRKQGYTR